MGKVGAQCRAMGSAGAQESLITVAPGLSQAVRC